MLKRKNKKGFTLAELLIVVAIIAVLVAIAVPLFVGAVKDAEDSVLNANKRAVRGAAVEQILLTPELRYKTAGDVTTEYDKWKVQAVVSASGDILAMDITPNEEGTETNSKKDASSNKVENQGTKDDYYIELSIKELKATNKVTP